MAQGHADSREIEDFFEEVRKISKDFEGYRGWSRDIEGVRGTSRGIKENKNQHKDEKTIFYFIMLHYGSDDGDGAV